MNTQRATFNQNVDIWAKRCNVPIKFSEEAAWFRDIRERIEIVHSSDEHDMLGAMRVQAAMLVAEKLLRDKIADQLYRYAAAEVVAVALHLNKGVAAMEAYFEWANLYTDLSVFKYALRHFNLVNHVEAIMRQGKTFYKEAA